MYRAILTSSIFSPTDRHNLAQPKDPPRSCCRNEDVKGGGGGEFPYKRTLLDWCTSPLVTEVSTVPQTACLQSEQRASRERQMFYVRRLVSPIRTLLILQRPSVVMVVLVLTTLTLTLFDDIQVG